MKPTFNAKRGRWQQVREETPSSGLERDPHCAYEGGRSQARILDARKRPKTGWRLGFCALNDALNWQVFFIFIIIII
jgi:hypothetical protein